MYPALRACVASRTYIKGAFVSGLDINYMNGLETPGGAEGITSVGVARPLGYGFVISQNAVLTSAIALANTQYPPLSLDISNNSQLACVPQQWPLKDERGNTIRNGKALHDPCLFSCNSASGRCSQSATGIQSESNCDNTCSKPTYIYM
jgi:hypothetical protein